MEEERQTSLQSVPTCWTEKILQNISLIEEEGFTLIHLRILAIYCGLGWSVAQGWSERIPWRSRVGDDSRLTIAGKWHVELTLICHQIENCINF